MIQAKQEDHKRVDVIVEVLKLEVIVFVSGISLLL